MRAVNQSAVPAQQRPAAPAVQPEITRLASARREVNRLMPTSMVVVTATNKMYA